MSLIFIDYCNQNSLSLIIIDYHWLLFIIIYYLWLSLIVIDFHWLSLIIWKSKTKLNRSAADNLKSRDANASKNVPNLNCTKKPKIIWKIIWSKSVPSIPTQLHKRLEKHFKLLAPTICTELQNLGSLDWSGLIKRISSTNRHVFSRIERFCWSF